MVELFQASELQTTMMETMEAVDVEKQKHNNTRMEALARLARLEVLWSDLNGIMRDMWKCVISLSVYFHIWYVLASFHPCL